jgi:hypothetical protein
MSQTKIKKKFPAPPGEGGAGAASNSKPKDTLFVELAPTYQVSVKL